MKRLFITLGLVFTLVSNAYSQEIYYEIRRSAQENIDNPATNALVKQFSLFKLEALNYMIIKMKEEIPDSTAEFLDKEALALNTFLTLYTNSLMESKNEPAAHQVKVIKAYMDASFSNPLFNDPDKDMVLAYYKNGKSMTRFSLDTDWRRAVLAANEAMKKLK
jgi:hypothetical protein